MLNSRGEKIPRLWDGSDMRVCVRVLTVLGAFPVYEYIYILYKKRYFLHGVKLIVSESLNMLAH